ncbi:cilia- and flagella-associated protein 99 [Takifugu flavidus]|nr:cilia- and flagella-associated protein 99 [Takifugu flavidus]XP_056867949.1 cilia- and flagella-associated protein 99 [Takifugu flavidus]
MMCKVQRCRISSRTVFALQRSASQYKMAPSYESLVKEAIVLIDLFNGSAQCLDAFIEDVSKDLQKMDASHKNFILDVVSGCVEHKKLLDPVIKVFYAQIAKHISRRDCSQFVIICYLLTFALDDLGLRNFSNIVKSLDIKKMQLFLVFFFTNLTTAIQEEWSMIYDAAFVETQWILPLLRWRPEIDLLIGQLAVMSSGNQMKKAPVKTTEPKEFSLTKPKPAAVPVPELIPLQEKCKPVPVSTYQPPKEMQKIEEIKKKNQQRTKELLIEANMNQFSCVKPQKSKHTEDMMTQIQTDLDAKLKFNSFHASGLPPSNKAMGKPVKLNSTAILRQKTLHDRRAEEELQRMQKLVEGGHELSPYLQWQRDMREQDLQEELAMIGRRHLEGRISHEEAAAARVHVVERNQKTAQLTKEETAELMKKYAEQRLQEEKGMRELVQQVADGHKNSKLAKEKLHKFKQDIVREFSKQNQELLRQALEEAQADLLKKFEIIREARTRPRNLPPCDRGNHLDEAQVNQETVRWSLSLQKEQQQKEQQELLERVRSLRKEKQQKEQQLQDAMETIELHRKVSAKAAAIRKEEEQKRQLAIRQRAAEDETNLALRRKLEENRKERERLKQSQTAKAQDTSKPAAFKVTTGQKLVSQKSWEEMEKRLEGYIERLEKRQLFNL